MTAGSFSLSTACKAAGFAAAAYRTPPSTAQPVVIGKCNITYLENVTSALPLVETRCSCYGVGDVYRRFAFIDDAGKLLVEHDPRGPQLLLIEVVSISLQKFVECVFTTISLPPLKLLDLDSVCSYICGRLEIASPINISLYQREYELRRKAT